MKTFKGLSDYMVKIDGGWMTEEVAAGQRALVELELAKDPHEIAPYEAFLRAVDLIAPGPGWKFLDVGCGVGHYGTLLRLYRDDFHLGYHGADASPAMIRAAREREPGLYFSVQTLENQNYAGYDIVLASSAVEVTSSPLAHISRILEQTPGFVIWHRIRLDAESGFITEGTYGGHQGRIWLWRLEDLDGLLALSGRRSSIVRWPETSRNLTVVAWPRERHG